MYDKLLRTCFKHSSIILLNDLHGAFEKLRNSNADKYLIEKLCSEFSKYQANYEHDLNEKAKQALIHISNRYRSYVKITKKLFDFDYTPHHESVSILRSILYKKIGGVCSARLLTDLALNVMKNARFEILYENLVLSMENDVIDILGLSKHINGYSNNILLHDLRCSVVDIFNTNLNFDLLSLNELSTLKTFTN